MARTSGLAGRIVTGQFLEAVNAVAGAVLRIILLSEVCFYHANIFGAGLKFQADIGSTDYFSGLRICIKAD